MHWRLCEKYKLDRTNDYKPKGVIENVNYKILWNAMIKWDKKILKPENQTSYSWIRKKQEIKIIDVAVPGDVRIWQKELEKIDKYKPLKDEIVRLWNMRRVTVIPIVVGALGLIITRFDKSVEEVEIEMRVEYVQKTALLGTARVLRLVLGS